MKLLRKDTASLSPAYQYYDKNSADAILYGTKGKKLELHYDRSGVKGVLRQPLGNHHNLERRYKETQSDSMRRELEAYMTSQPCPVCGGKRLSKTSLSVTVGGVNIYDFTSLPITKAIEFIRNLKLGETEAVIAERVVKEILARLEFLRSVGLDYLTLSRSVDSLSGGENQRIRLATQIGSSLVGVLYILDEPSIGLHQRDNMKLLNTLFRLRDLGNTIIVVEHDEETIAAADYVVDIGPGAGIHGGNIVFAGTPEELCRCDESITGRYLSGKEKIPVPAVRRKGNGKMLTVRGAAETSSNPSLSIPLARSRVSRDLGSGKSSFVNEILYKALAAS